MGCTSSHQTGTTKENTNLTSTAIIDDGQQLINDHFRKWLKTNRPKADEYVLNDVLLTAQPSNEVEDYKIIVGKALDLLSERHDIKSTNKLGKLVQKEITLASPKKVAHTIDILKQTAEKLRNGNIQLDLEQHTTTTTANETTNDTSIPETQHIQVSSGEPGIALKEALEKARILFYKGKQAAIFANPNGGYDVRILDENDETIKHNGNLLRSIIVTEVKMRPKPPTTTSPLFIPPPPPPSSSKLLDENEISDDFRRSIDAALKGLEAVYQTSSSTTTTTSPISEHIQAIHVDKITKSTPSPITPVVIQYGVTNIPLSKSTSKEKTTLSNDLSATIDHTVNLAEIIRQMAEQQKIVSVQLSQDNNEGKEKEFFQADIQPKLVGLVDNVNDLMMDTIEVTTCSEIGNPISLLQHDTIENVVIVKPTNEKQGQIERIVKEIKEHGEKFESKESLPPIISTIKQPSSYSIGLTSPLQNESLMTSSTTSVGQQKTKLRSENRPKSFIANEETPSKKNLYNLNKQTSLDELVHLTQTGLSNPNLTKSITKLGVSTSSGKIEEEQEIPIVTAEPLTKMPTSISQIIEEHRTILDEPSSTAFPSPPIVTPVDTHIKAKSPSHNVTYTEIIHSETRDGEQSRRFISESSNQNPLNDDEQTTTLKVITKSEFSNHPTLGEKIMEQSVQVITVKVRNETIKTTIQQTSLPSTTDNDITYERRPVSELVKNFEVVAAANASSVNT
ncbi:unnamed protein product [Rotaria sp. Silwood1]|nr:unnamed protein product [Rotaria sp. Silwood1]CAF1056802.1 unnamed protein product [Rotaria sp. Silwood1]CAF3431969.1 unnamed protein product [Rotaria sp. Silwood1]CAF3436355.1 unnamed protein product [Rotaria sp. Silwood1]CAF4556719.1 unnamed protein product [Rotaria sp. Silwood1]